jgi:hypothetical protein
MERLPFSGFSAGGFRVVSGGVSLLFVSRIAGVSRHKRTPSEPPRLPALAGRTCARHRTPSSLLGHCAG